MKFYFFHLMPWPDLPGDFDDKVSTRPLGDSLQPVLRSGEGTPSLQPLSRRA